LGDETTKWAWSEQTANGKERVNTRRNGKERGSIAEIIVKETKMAYKQVGEKMARMPKQEERAKHEKG
jgi:hypothetical protein